MKVVFLGCTSEYGFGFGANITKIGYMANGLKHSGAECVIHNGIDGTKKVMHDQTVMYDGFQVTTLKQSGPKYLSPFLNAYKIIKFLKIERKKGEQNVAILEYDFYHIFLFYIIILKLLGYTIVDISHEWLPSIKKKNCLKKISSGLFASTFGWFVDGILPISEYIIEKIQHFNKPYLKLPIMADFSQNDSFTPGNEHNFVYCASVLYSRIIKMIIDSYAQYRLDGGTINLTLILNGRADLIQNIQDYINNAHLEKNVVIKSKLAYRDLLDQYYNSKALLIPLDPNYVQDKARFSQKIAEYLSSKSPLITNDVGEVKYYFTSEEVIKCDYSPLGFTNAFKWVEKNPEKAKQIGLQGFNKGQEAFDFRKLGEQMFAFFKSL